MRIEAFLKQLWKDIATPKKMENLTRDITKFFLYTKASSASVETIKLIFRYYI